MYIAIEGMDGVGKTTIAKKLAEKINFKFVEKPMQFLYGSKDEHKRISSIINNNKDRNLTSLYYWFMNFFSVDYFKKENFVIDRHVVSNYCWSGINENEDIYKLLITKIDKPMLTVILYANEKTIHKRILDRCRNDQDIMKVSVAEEKYKKMISFCEKYKLNYILIDTSNLSVDKVVDKIVMEYEKYK